MKHNHLRAAGASAFAVALLGTTLASGASARPDPGPTIDQRVYEQHYGTVAGDASANAVEHRGVGSGAVAQPSRPTSVARARASLASDDTPLEVGQVGAGVLGGIALAGAAALAMGRRRHAHAAHPA